MSFVTSRGGVGVGGNDENTLALLSLVQSSEVSLWTKSLKGWEPKSDLPVCDWDGITCSDINVNNNDDKPVIKEINLPALGIARSLPGY